MSAYQLAQVNIARPLGPIGTPVMQDFVDNLDPVNDVADASPGFVWRLQTPDGNATALHVFGDEAEARLTHLRAHGPTQVAFTFRDVFPPPDQQEEPAALTAR